MHFTLPWFNGVRINCTNLPSKGIRAGTFARGSTVPGCLPSFPLISEKNKEATSKIADIPNA
jgi:hypothetical protein